MAIESSPRQTQLVLSSVTLGAAGREPSWTVLNAGGASDLHFTRPKPTNTGTQRHCHVRSPAWFHDFALFLVAGHSALAFLGVSVQRVARFLSQTSRGNFEEGLP
jgi:hypothetical protein